MARNGAVFETTKQTPRSFSGLSSANDRADAAFTVGPVREMAIAYAWSVCARRPLKEKEKKSEQQLLKDKVD